MTLFFVGYLYLLHHPSGNITRIPTTIVDQIVPFSMYGLPVYLSLWLYVSLPNFLIHTFAELADYGWRVATPCVLGLAIFYFYPTMITPNPADWHGIESIEFLKKVDAAGNACPSLHVAMALYSCLWMHWRLARIRAAKWVNVINWAWCIGIIWSTMAIRQHFFIDVLAGILLALTTAYLTRLKSHAMRLT
ncbi:phosphatase PAP2 family protein [Leeia sp. TBRC 13508]|uniref:Phosphatase PAP2 family protein n=1 Tax=Leeia speluncae TaxID=2884804 RepID=A0ABS8D401_9NEIS|nr:phosphatase PAP2 family protein [Leeia speluncae]MCB6182915.1 phosphatase PAP2 family protein [Leeia speluncae]